MGDQAGRTMFPDPVHFLEIPEKQRALRKKTNRLPPLPKRQAILQKVRCRLRSLRGLRVPRSGMRAV